MKKIILVLILLINCFILVGCNKTTSMYLEEKYYNNAEFINLDINTLNTLIDNKETFVIFIYQPLCYASNDFEKVLTEFINTNNISIYKLAYTDMKETNLKEKIQYYPSFIIYQKGKVVDYLDANSNDDLEYYKNINGFTKWFTKYIKLY